MKLAVRRVAPTCGYGNVAEGLVRALNRAGVETVDHEERAPVLLHILPTHFLHGVYEGQTAWMLSMWETDGCPEGMRAGFGNFDGIFVPTENNLATFSAHHPNVHRIDMGVDTTFWTPKPRRVDGPFRFLYTQHSPRRKGGDIAQAAGRIVARERDIEMVDALAASDEELRDLYWSCHAYLQPSRGEGWGMMPHQALATGMPAVISDCPGHREYGWLPGCYLTETTPTPAALTFHGEPGNWWEPSLDAVVERMCWVIDNYDEAHSNAQRAAALCVEHFSWDRIASEVIAAIGLDVLNGPDPMGDLMSPIACDFPVVPNRNQTCTIGDRTLHLIKGKEIDVSADVKRVLREAGLLDESVAA